MNKFEQLVECSPAFDKRHVEPGRNYGIGAMRIYFVLKGKKGAVQFAISTGFHLPHVHDELERKLNVNNYNPFKISGLDIGYHSIEPITDCKMDCQHTGVGYCYYDGSGLRADEFIPKFLEGGSDAVWLMLEAFYKEIFNSDE